MEKGLILNNIWYTRLVHSLIVIVLALFAYKFITYLLNRSENKSNIKVTDLSVLEDKKNKNKNKEM